MKKQAKKETYLFGKLVKGMNAFCVGKRKRERVYKHMDNGGGDRAVDTYEDGGSVILPLAEKEDEE